MVMYNLCQALVWFPVQPWCSWPALVRGGAGSAGSTQGPCGSSTNCCSPVPVSWWPQGHGSKAGGWQRGVAGGLCNSSLWVVSGNARVCLLDSDGHDGCPVSSALISPHRMRQLWKCLKLPAAQQEQRYYTRVCLSDVLTFDSLEQEKQHLPSGLACTEINTCSTAGNCAADLCSRGCSVDGCCGLFKVKSSWTLWLGEMQTVMTGLTEIPVWVSEYLHPLHFNY